MEENMKTNIEFRKGILFIRLNGALIRRNINKFESEILPVILKQGLKYVVINLENLEYLDKYGIESLSNLYEIIRRNNGRTSFCNMSEEIKNMIKNTNIYDKFFNTNNELTALELFKL